MTKEPLSYKIVGDNLIISGGVDEDALDIYDALEPLIANSELNWIYPADTGDLTDAPMVGFLGEQFTYSGEGLPPYPCVFAGADGDKKIFHKITHRWAYMSYQVKSPLEDLRENEEITLTGGEL